MYVVTLRQPDGTPITRNLDRGGECIVGRGRSVDNGTGLPVEQDKLVSRRHLKLYDQDGHLFVEDLGSSNGTIIGSEKLAPGQKYPLGLDQPVELGASQLTVDLAYSFEQTRISPPAYKPKFVGVLYTDIVSSTVMTGRLGPEKATELLEWHNQTFRERFKRYNGKETKFTGDGFEVIFPSVTDGLSCAAACQRALARRNQVDSTGWRLEVRMGINGGEAPTSTSKNKNRVYGMPLIIAARVMAQADAAQVLVPVHVSGIVAGSLLRFTSIGLRDLKGIERPMELLEYHWQFDPSVRGAAEAEPGSAGVTARK